MLTRKTEREILAYTKALKTRPKASNMRRRDVLKYAGAATAVGMTGCLSEGNGEPGNQTDDGDDGNGTDDDGKNDGNGTTVTDSSLSVVSEGERDEDESASFRFEDGTLRVRGVIVGSDLCKTAELESTEYDGDRGALVVSVVTVDTDDSRDVCGEALKPIEYEATVEFDGEQPSVVVTHDGEEVEAERGMPDDEDEAETTSLADSEFEVTGSECGTETNEAEYTASQGTSEDDASEGVVEGTLSGPDGCATAELGYVSYDSEQDTLVADVRTARTDAEGCGACITEVSYSLVAEFENGVADSASVSHDGVVFDGVGDDIENAEFTVEGIDSASGDRASPDAEFNEDEGSIVVTGMIRGNDGCAVARLAEAYVEDGGLVVDVETVSNGGEMCTQQLVDIRYTATVSFDGEIPNEVSVSHDGEDIMGAAYSSNSVSAAPSDE